MWQSSDKVKIVFNNYDYNINHNGKKYPMAFVVVNDAQLNTAIKWATGEDIKVKIIETDNKDFTFSLANAPERSYSQGGKLSFCNCIVEKEGIPSFAVGINTEYLFANMFDTTVVKGVFQDKVIFAKQNNNTGAIVMGSKIYNEVMADAIAREKVATGTKTKKWIRGSVYCSPTLADLYLGEFTSQIESHIEDSRTSLIFKQNPKKKHVFMSYNASDSLSLNVGRIFNAYHYDQKLPARVWTEALIPNDEHYIKNLEKLYETGIEEDVSSDNYVCTYYLIERAFYFYDVDPEYTKKILNIIIDLRAKYPDIFDDDSRYYRFKDFKIEWDGNTYITKSYEECIKKFIEII